MQPFWAQLTLKDRARYLERTAQVLIDETDDIRDLIVREQGKPRNEAFSMEILPTVDSLRWIARAGMEILADEQLPMPQLYLKTKSAAFSYEPLGVIARDLPLELPLEHPAGRSGAGADGGQRRRSQARVVDPADRRADRQGVRAGRAARGPAPGGARTGHRRRAGALERRQGLLHRLGGGRS